jgi:hypothetical protein
LDQMDKCTKIGCCSDLSLKEKFSIQARQYERRVFQCVALLKEKKFLTPVNSWNVAPVGGVSCAWAFSFCSPGGRIRSKQRPLSRTVASHRDRSMLCMQKSSSVYTDQN